MRLRLIAVGTRMPAWVQAGVAEYTARFPREWRFELIEIPVAARAKNSRNGDIARLKDAEGEKISRLLPPAGCVIALDERGDSLSTMDLARNITGWQREGQQVSLLIGGPDGLAPGVLTRAHQRWSLSKLTLPHALARVLLAEQLYRGWTVLANHPYHRA